MKRFEKSRIFDGVDGCRVENSVWVDEDDGLLNKVRPKGAGEVE